MHGKKIFYFGESNDEIHTDVIATGFNSLTGITFRYILSNFPFHPGPPKVLPKVLVHFSTTRMNRELGQMCFIKDLFTKLMILRYNNTIVEL
jgi:hypothetical protein